MTVDTPFPSRPGTPFWSPRGLISMGSLGDDVTGITTAALNDAAAAYIATQQPGCPAGYVFNAAVGACQAVGTVTATGTASPGMLILIALAAYLFLKGGR